MEISRTEGMVQEGIGKVREGWGRVTDQPDVEAKGQFEQVMGQAKQFVGGIQQSVSKAVHQVRQDPSMENADTRKAALKLLAYVAAALVVINAIIHAPRRR